MINVNMTKAREIKRDQIRAERKALLEQLDVKYMIALEANDETAQADIKDKKQALRDAPADPAIDAASTPEELKTVRPTALDIEV